MPDIDVLMKSPDEIPGTYANIVQILGDPYGVMIQFLCAELYMENDTVPAVIVARVRIGERLLRELRDTLNEHVSKLDTLNDIDNLPEADQ